MTTYQPATPHTVSLQHSVTSSVVPPFGDSAFDAEATQAMGNAYDIACRSLHPKGRLPVIQGLLAKKIVQAAIASFVTAGFWLVTAIHRVMLPLGRKTSSKCSGF